MFVLRHFAKNTQNTNMKNTAKTIMVRIRQVWEWPEYMRNGIGNRKDTNTAWKKKRRKATIYCESCVCLMSPYSSGLASLVAWIILDSPYLLYPSADNYPVQENGICFGIKQAELEICSSLFPVTLGLLIYLLSCSCFSFEKIAIIPYKHKIVIINDACLIGP